jgi:hypothetical protein
MGARTRTIERRGAYVSNHHLIENCTRLFYGDGFAFYGELIRLAPLPPCQDDNSARDWESRRARPRGAIGRLIMPTFSPALITIMRAVLEEAMTKVPAEQATTVTKAYLAEFILKAAAEGLTSYEGLMVAAINQLPIILSMFS